METLAKLFDSSPRVKIMRLFLMHPDEIFEIAEVRTKSKVASSTLRRELNKLYSAGLIYQKSFSKELKTKTKKGTPRKKQVWGWQLDPEFSLLEPLKALVLNNESFDRRDITARLRGAGSVKLLIVSGIFLANDQSRIDVLVVGDGLKQELVSKAFKTLEAETGCELRYAAFKTDDFLYRVDLYDKFIRDILDYPHEKLVNKLGI